MMCINNLYILENDLSYYRYLLNSMLIIAFLFMLLQKTLKQSDYTF